MTKEVPTCPMCSSSKTWKDGIRRTNDGDIQRYLCRECGYRFSKTSWNRSDELEHVQRVHRKPLNTHPSLLSNRQICASQTTRAKNLVKVEIRKENQAAGATKHSEAEIRGRIVEFTWRLKKDGYSKSTIYSYSKFLILLIKYGANLYDPESVKDVIATQKSWGTSSKLMAVAAYTFFTSLNQIPWNPPKYKPKRRLPFIPLENEIDNLIAAAAKKLATSLQLVKETGMRIGEACKLRWIDVDLQRHTITVNDPEKGSNPRMFKISSKLAAMINTLPRKTIISLVNRNPETLPVISAE